MNFNNYDPEVNGEYSFLQSISAEVQTLFDVGAHTGAYSHRLLSLAPQVRVFAFEPIEELCARITPHPHLTIFPAAIGDAIRTETVFYNPGNPGLTSIHIPGVKMRPVEVVQYTLDHVVGELAFLRPALAKIDVEGHEIYVLQGMTKCLERGLFKWIQFEYGGTYRLSARLLEEAFAIFRIYSYTVHHLLPTGLLPCPFFDPEWENFEYSNWVAIKN